MVASYRPDLYLGVAFNADPNSSDTPTWTDLTNRLRHADGIKRGRQYELDQNQAGQPTMVLWDPDEYLNPGNPSSPYSPNVVPYRQILMQAVWPNPAAGNLLNAKAVPTGYDPAFETTAVGGTPPNLLTYNTSPTVQAANPWQGTKSLQWSVAGNSSEQVAGFTIPTIPGRQYTASAYYRQTAANTGVLFVNGGPGSTTTTATNTYMRLTVTFTASQPTHQLFVGSFSPTLASTVNIDAIQLEQGSSASAFTTTGSVIYPVLRDYVERWPTSWDPNSAGFAGLAEITCVDAFAALQGVDLHTEYRNALLAKAPDLYWPLSEPSGSTTFAQASSASSTPLVRLDLAGSPSGPPPSPPTYAPGTQMNIAGDPGGVGVQISFSTGSLQPPITCLQAGEDGAAQINLDATGNVAGLSVALWASWGTLVTGQGNFLTLFDTAGSSYFTIFWQNGSGFQAGIVTNGRSNTWATPFYNVSAQSDNKPHLLIVTVDIENAGTTVNLYVDGTLVTQTPTDTSPSSHKLNGPFTQLALGALSDPLYSYTGAGLPGGTYSHLGLWKRVLSPSEVTDLWKAGQGFAGETSGARVARYLGYSYAGTTAVDTGQSTMGPGTVAENTTALAAIQQVTLSENGNFWVDATGTPTFAARTRRYLATTSKVTLGENTAAGEIPYLGDIKFNFDPTYVYNDVQVTRTGGILAHTPDAPSQRKYFKRGYPRTIDVASDLEAIDAANWILNTHKDPHQRVERITLDPVGNPAIWPAVLGLEIGSRVTVKRRASAANGGAGLTMSADYFVESIEHSSIDMDAGTWTTTLLLSPAIGYQVGIFDDATYGRFDQTLIFGY